LNVTSFSNFDELQTGEKIYIRLDVFHAIQRISKTLLHSHGAFQLFMARLKDAFFLVSKDDIDSVVGGLRSEKGYTDIQVQEWKSKNGDSFSSTAGELFRQRTSCLRVLTKYANFSAIFVT
jgi:hypothetical protein